jgi:hypothetical protein
LHLGIAVVAEAQRARIEVLAMAHHQVLTFGTMPAPLRSGEHRASRKENGIMLSSILLSIASIVEPAHAVHPFLTEYYEAYRNGTADDLAGFYAADVVFFDISQGHHYEGRAALTESLVHRR